MMSRARNDLLRPAVTATGVTRVMLSHIPLQIWEEARTGLALSSNITHLVGKLVGTVYTKALLSSLTTLVQRHRILTARVEELPTGAYLCMDEHFVPQLEVVDFRTSPPDINGTLPEKRVAEIVNDRVWQPFEFVTGSGQSGPLMRAFLII